MCTDIGYIGKFFRGKMRRRNKEFRKEIEQTSAIVMDMVEMIPVTRAHALENQEISKLTSQINLIAEKGYHLDIIQSVFGSVNWLEIQLFQVSCLLFTSIMAFKGKIIIGEITLYQTYFMSLVNQVSYIISLILTISKGTESISSVGEILVADDIENNRGKKKINNLEGEYEF